MEEKNRTLKGNNYMGWDIDVKEKLYMKLADEIFFRILNGSIPVGGRLPTLAVLIREAGTSQGTMWKAMRLLLEWKIVIKTRKGYFVTDNQQVIQDVRNQLIERETGRYREKLLKMGCNVEVQVENLSHNEDVQPE